MTEEKNYDTGLSYGCCGCLTSFIVFIIFIFLVWAFAFGLKVNDYVLKLGICPPSVKYEKMQQNDLNKIEEFTVVEKKENKK